MIQIIDVRTHLVEQPDQLTPQGEGRFGCACLLRIPERGELLGNARSRCANVVESLVECLVGSPDEVAMQRQSRLPHTLGVSRLKPAPLLLHRVSKDEQTCVGHLANLLVDEPLCASVGYHLAQPDAEPGVSSYLLQGVRLLVDLDLEYA